MFSPFPLNIDKCIYTFVNRSQFANSVDPEVIVPQLRCMLPLRSITLVFFRGDSCLRTPVPITTFLEETYTPEA